MNKKNGVKQDIDLVSLIERYRNESKCRDYLEELRWPDGIVCPRCASSNVSTIAEREQYHCLSCQYHFSITSGTIFHDSHLPLWKWFLAAYMMIESKKGVSANQIKRTLNISYKTAWFLCHRIREAMTVDNPIPLSKIVEVDETWVGGKRKGVGHGYKGNKVVVAGAAQRDGEARLEVIDDRTREVLHQFIKKHVAPDAEAIYTDDWPAYDGIADENTKHETVNHSADEWVRGDVHTNYVENIWSLLKRSLVGSYHKVSKKHLEAYLDELEWRFNNRENPYLFRDTLLKLIKSENLKYKELTGTKNLVQ
jgi:transposase-like protein